MNQKAFRTGIYLTNVERQEDRIEFNLLRCSTNLSGPTDIFRSVDDEIIDKVNSLAGPMFETPIRFNHVLAQIYENKAIIEAHFDKTKDMPIDALIAFNTFSFKEVGY